MPIPEQVDRQDGNNSCGYHALANAINLLNPAPILTPQALMNGAEQNVQRLAPGTLNDVLAKKNLPYKATRPTDEQGLVPMAQVLKGNGIQPPAR